MDIHSPSRVMAGMGGHIVDGIGVGLNNRTPALQGSIGKRLASLIVLCQQWAQAPNNL